MRPFSNRIPGSNGTCCNPDHSPFDWPAEDDSHDSWVARLFDDLCSWTLSHSAIQHISWPPFSFAPATWRTDWTSALHCLESEQTLRPDPGGPHRGPFFCLLLEKEGMHGEGPCVSGVSGFMVNNRRLQPHPTE